MRFTDDSYWNTPLGPLAVPDPESDWFIESLQAVNDNTYLGLTSNAWSMPVYRATPSDSLVTIAPRWGPRVTFRLPTNAVPATSNDGALCVIDASTHQDISLFEFRRDAGTPKATGTARYWLDSEGIDEKMGGTLGNRGHRGIPGLVSCVRYGHIHGDPQRLKIAIPGTADWSCYPMSLAEQGKGGVIGEGMILRVKASVDVRERIGHPTALIIATMLQVYGAVVGDNGGVAALKIEKGINVPSDALAGLAWDDYEFVRRGWTP